MLQLHLSHQQSIAYLGATYSRGLTAMLLGLITSYTIYEWWAFVFKIMLCFVGVVFFHDDVIKWRHFPRYWSFVPGIHRSPVNSPHKSQWRGAFMFSLICAWINGWVNNRKTGNLGHHRANYDVTVLFVACYTHTQPDRYSLYATVVVTKLFIGAVRCMNIQLI